MGGKSKQRGRDTPSDKCLQIDVIATSKVSGIERHRLARVIAQWEMHGLITSNGSKVRNVST
jgi:hypothetical protein